MSIFIIISLIIVGKCIRLYIIYVAVIGGIYTFYKILNRLLTM